MCWFTYRTEEPQSSKFCIIYFRHLQANYRYKGKLEKIEKKLLWQFQEIKEIYEFDYLKKFIEANLKQYVCFFKFSTARISVLIFNKCTFL